MFGAAVNDASFLAMDCESVRIYTQSTPSTFWKAAGPTDDVLLLHGSDAPSCSLVLRQTEAGRRGAVESGVRTSAVRASAVRAPWSLEQLNPEPKRSTQEEAREHARCSQACIGLLLVSMLVAWWTLMACSWWRTLIARRDFPMRRVTVERLAERGACTPPNAAAPCPAVAVGTGPLGRCLNFPHKAAVAREFHRWPRRRAPRGSGGELQHVNGTVGRRTERRRVKKLGFRSTN